MGYESKVFIVRRSEYVKDFFGNLIENPQVSALIVAQYDLCKVGYDNKEFFDAFRREIDYDLYLPGCDDNGNERILPQHEDCYGEHMKSAGIPELIAALKTCEARKHYRRFPPLIAMLEAFDESEWNSENHRLEAVHYGY